jgi:hypothetical protein
MRYWFDTEFDERSRNIDLISIGIVSEDGRRYYAVNADYDTSKANDWLKMHVLQQLNSSEAKPALQIRREVLEFFSPAPTEIWAYFGEYDWIVLRQLIGHMLDWPASWPLSHMNLEQYRLMLNPDIVLPQQSTNIHHALNDAVWTKDAWAYLQNLPRADIQK